MSRKENNDLSYAYFLFVLRWQFNKLTSDNSCLHYHLPITGISKQISIFLVITTT